MKLCSFRPDPDADAEVSEGDDEEEEVGDEEDVLELFQPRVDLRITHGVIFLSLHFGFVCVLNAIVASQHFNT